MIQHPRERLSAYADGEVDRTEAAELERHLETCTECSRELAIVRGLKGAMREMESDSAQKDLWESVHRRLTVPAGWFLLMVGLLFWAGLAVVRWFQEEVTIEWLVGSAVITGFVLLLIGIGHEQYRQWKNERYKDVER